MQPEVVGVVLTTYRVNSLRDVRKSSQSITVPGVEHTFPTTENHWAGFNDIDDTNMVYNRDGERNTLAGEEVPKTKSKRSVCSIQ